LKICGITKLVLDSIRFKDFDKLKQELENDKSERIDFITIYN